MTTRDEEALRVAAVPTRQRIQDMTKGKSARIRQMLEYIDDQLFSPDLSVQGLKTACKIRNNAITTQFHAAVGMPPNQFISDMRLKVARRLLERTDLPVWKISELLGYSSIQVFSRTFARVVGHRPTVHRRQALESGSKNRAKSLDRFDFAALRSLLDEDLPTRALITGVTALVWDFAEHRGAVDE